MRREKRVGENEAEWTRERIMNNGGEERVLNERRKEKKKRER